MNENFVLYEDPQIRVRVNERSPEDHYLDLLGGGKEEREYIIPRGCLRELATTTRDRFPLKIDTLNWIMLNDANERGLTADSIGFALAQAYIESERRYQDVASSMRAERIAQNE
ncbi:hypothetical protein J4218_00395 [Candidatus Pacearchaeota archaeon]|nr:hypothetical protein [Candidatus Pacearchaeota archaeon]